MHKNIYKSKKCKYQWGINNVHVSLQVEETTINDRTFDTKNSGLRQYRQTIREESKQLFLYDQDGA